MTPDERLTQMFHSLAHLPRFPDGRIDYTHANEAPALNVFVKYRGKLLIVKRSDRVLHYKGLWHVVAGYLDDSRESLRDAALKEVREELGVDGDAVRSVHVEQPFTAGSDRVWHVFCAVVELADTATIALDWEATAYDLVEPDELLRRPHVPGVERAVHTVLKYFT
jgi:8-oxo-dGTP pyrophosphatase MutT (NUDIX family)